MDKQKTILIVDDQESVIKSLKRLLLPEHYNIISAHDAQSALEMIREHQDITREEKENIFLIISDQRMPGMTGVEFLEKTVGILPDAIRFILSGYSDKKDMADTINKGVVHRYLTKPWNSKELLIMVRHACEYPEKMRGFTRSNCVESEGLECNIMERDLKEFDERGKDRALGRIALHHGFINQEQMDISMTAMQIDRQAGRSVSLENILFEKGFISSGTMGKLVATTRRRLGKSFGSIAIKDFGVTREEIERCLSIQAKEFSETSTCRLLGDILVSEKILTEDQKDSIIIDMTYTERDDLVSENSQNGSMQKYLKEQNPVAQNDKPEELSDTIILNKRKKKFFRHRALDKIFCKSAIKSNFATEPEVLSSLEEQLLHFMRTSEIRLIRDILIERSIMSQAQADMISAKIAGEVYSSPSQHKIHADTDKNLVQNSVAEHKLTDTKNPTKSQKSLGNQKNIISIGQNSAFKVTIGDDDMEATIDITGDVPEGMTADNLKEILAAHQIIYGLADDLSIELFLKNVGTEKERFVIARGKPAKKGRNSLIKYFFEDHNADFGKVLDSGQFDYRDRGEVVNVESGHIIAEKIPLIPSVNGITVRGSVVEGPAPVDVNLDCGKGVEISQDGLKLIATTNGRPDLSLGGKISVLPEIVIKGDVDFKTGNVKFSGDVTVQGAILAGFSVSANNLTVSDIEAAEINITNRLLIKSSVNDSTIRTGGTIAAQIIKKSMVVARGDVVVQKEIIDSTIITSGKVMVPRGRIVASTIRAAKGIEAMDIGSGLSSPCHLFPGAEDHALDIIKKFTDGVDLQKERLLKLESLKEQYEQQNLNLLNKLSEISKVQEQLAEEKVDIRKKIAGDVGKTPKSQIDSSLDDLDKRLLEMDSAINILFDEHDRTQNKVNEIKSKTNVVNQQMQILLKEKNGFEMWYEALRQEARKQGIHVLVKGTIFARTQITGPNCSITLKTNVKNSRIHQVVNSEEPSNTFHEMRIDSLSSK